MLISQADCPQACLTDEYAFLNIVNHIVTLQKVFKLPCLLPN